MYCNLRIQEKQREVHHENKKNSHKNLLWLAFNRNFALYIVICTAFWEFGIEFKVTDSHQVVKVVRYQPSPLLVLNKVDFLSVALR